MSDIQEESTPFISWDGKSLFIEGAPFFPVVQSEGVPCAGYNAVMLRLEGGLHDDLNWKKELEQAKVLTQQGFYILWELGLGIGSSFSLDDEPSFLTLKIALEEFSKKIQPFSRQSIGVVLYKGKADCSKEFLWTEKQQENFKKWLEDRYSKEERALKNEAGLEALFCLDSLLHFLMLFTPYLPDSLPVVLCLDLSSVASFYEAADFLHKERFEHFILAVKGAKIPFAGLAWEEGGSSMGYLGNKTFTEPSSAERVGLLFSRASLEEEAFETMVEALNSRGISFRLLYENFATQDWDGLDYIVHATDAISVKTKRILHGFCAAGGRVVSREGMLGMANETSVAEFFKEI